MRLKLELLQQHLIHPATPQLYQMLIAILVMDQNIEEVLASLPMGKNVLNGRHRKILMVCLIIFWLIGNPFSYDI